MRKQVAGLENTVLRSMTGYARARAANDAYVVTVELRALNHRYLDVRTRAAFGITTLEKQVRDHVSGALTRGKVDVTLHVESRGESAFRIDVDRPLAREFVRVARELAKEAGVEGDLSVADLASFTAAFQVKEREVSEGSLLSQALDKALEAALSDLTSMREAEAAEIGADLAARVNELAGRVDRIEALSRATREERRKELLARVSELLGTAVEPPVVAMEVTRLVERSDITEEIARLRSHVELWRTTTAEGGPCGKKLDFIAQEIHREVNTIGSKCQDAAIAEHVIAAKTELERIREQVQNIE